MAKAKVRKITVDLGADPDLAAAGPIDLTQISDSLVIMRNSAERGRLAARRASQAPTEPPDDDDEGFDVNGEDDDGAELEGLDAC